MPSTAALPPPPPRQLVLNANEVRLSKLAIQPAFPAAWSEGTFSGNVVIATSSRISNLAPKLDNNSNMGSNGEFTAPVRGIYDVNWGGAFSALSSGTTAAHVFLCRSTGGVGSNLGTVTVVGDLWADMTLTDPSVTTTRPALVHLNPNDTLFLTGSNVVVRAASQQPFFGITLKTLTPSDRVIL